MYSERLPYEEGTDLLVLLEQTAVFFGKSCLRIWSYRVRMKTDLSLMGLARIAARRLHFLCDRSIRREIGAIRLYAWR
jgi:hypothetical protein